MERIKTNLTKLNIMGIEANILFLGLPFKTIEYVDNNGANRVVGVTTEVTDALIGAVATYDLDLGQDFGGVVAEFDSYYGYAVPNEVFVLDSTEIFNYILTNIDTGLLIEI